MTRYFLKLTYDGTDYSGWQRQPNAPTIQESIENALNTLLREKNAIIGCGRTDAGVHAAQFFAHVDTTLEMDMPTIMFKLNNMIGKDIVIKKILQVADNSHARYDAVNRSYKYQICRNKPLMDRREVFYYFMYDKLNKEKMKNAASLIAEHSEFETFCKSNTQVKTKTCIIAESRLEFDDVNHYIYYHISANRFLRGMVRLIVGALLNVGLGRVSIEEIRTALENQTKLKREWSVPALGLSLTQVKYPYELE